MASSISSKVLLCQTLKTVLQDNGFFTLILQSCNGTKGVDFSHADVVLTTEKVIDCMKDGEPKDVITSAMQLNAAALDFSQLFISTIFEEFCSGKTPKEYEDIFALLLDYLDDLKNHQDALKSVKLENESTVAALLSKHIFSCLVPEDVYVLDNNSKPYQLSCPCQCKASINIGNTSLGSAHTWHGFADVLLNQNIALTFLEDKVGYDGTDVADDGDAEPADKKKKIDQVSSDDISVSSDSYRIPTEVKSNPSGEKKVVFTEGVFDHILAETITNSFAQVNMDPELSGFFIPTLACTSEYVAVFLYDSKNDILMQASDVISLWNGPIINIEAVVQLWMILNFTRFTRPNLYSEYELSKSNFHQLVKGKLKKYKTLRCGELTSFSDDDFYENAYHIVYKHAKNVEKNHKT